MQRAFLKKSGTLLQKAAKAAPFTDKELIDRTLAREVRQNREVGPLLHWMDRDARTRLFLELYEEKGFPSVEKYLPFLETELLNRLASWNLNGTVCFTLTHWRLSLIKSCCNACSAAWRNGKG